MKTFFRHTAQIEPAETSIEQAQTNIYKMLILEINLLVINTEL